ncbi:recombinase family protein [Frankia sp. CiP3]|uniref:recombinase family protein n=1 Tax=Frankia sp. CiP3 TaxID=2880971 RepID=UPI001EF6EFA7|nr:recombinase family protein [Frankia sp. CiP3]
MSDTQRMKAGVYARVSTEEQVDGTSLEDQERRGRAVADIRGWQVVDAYVEEGYTGTVESRPEWDRLMADCRAGKVNVVIVLNWKRFARTARVGLALAAKLEEMDVALVVIENDVDTSTASGRFVRHMFIGLAELDRDNVVEQMARGQHAKARRGGWPGGDAPYGYRREGGGRDCVIAVNPDERAMLRAAIGWIVDEGLTTGECCRRLNAHGLLPRKGGEWGHQNLRRVLSSRTLIGECWWAKPRKRSGGHVATGKFGEPVMIKLEPLISEQRFEALQRALAAKAYGDRRPNRPYPLSVRMYSPCGSYYHGVWRHDRDLRQYRCHRRKWRVNDQTRCDCLYLSSDAVEARVWSTVVDLLSHPEKLLALASDYLGLRASQVTVERDQLAAVQRRIAELERALVRATKAALLADTPDERRALDAARVELQDDLAATRTREAALEQWQADSRAESDRMRQMWELAERAATRLGEMALEQQREVLRLLNVKVVVLDNTITPRLRITGSVPHQKLLGSLSGGDPECETLRSRICSLRATAARRSAASCTSTFRPCAGSPTRPASTS